MAQGNRGEANSMDILNQYISRADEIIGERTAEEKKYDHEVVRWLRRGKSISKAISKANQKYPTEALQLTMTIWLMSRHITNTWQNTTPSWRSWTFSRISVRGIETELSGEFHSKIRAVSCVHLLLH